MSRPVVLFIQRRLPTYRRDLFEELRTVLSRKGAQLALAVGGGRDDELVRGDEGALPWAVPAPNVYLPAGFNYQRLPWKLVARADLVLVPHEHRNLSVYAVIAVRKLLRKPFAFFGHGDNFQAPPSRRLFAIRTATARLPDWWFGYTEESRRRLAEVGIPVEKITVVQNATMRADAVKKTISDLSGTPARNCAVFIGSLHHWKRLAFLFQALQRIRREATDFEFHVIGDGPEAPTVRKWARENSWIKLHGHLEGDSLVAACRGACMALNPGMVGLSVADAFAMGIPTLTTNCRIHSPEIAYLRHGENGFITEDSVESFASAALCVLKDEALKRRLRAKCFETAGQLTVENMAENFVAGIQRLIPAISNEADGRPWRVAIMWQRFLEYHYARLNAVQRILVDGAQRIELLAIQVADSDTSYPFETSSGGGQITLNTLFPGENYNQLKASAIVARGLALLNEYRPDLVLAPATPFPEGMAAIKHRSASACRLIIMDDAWEATDFRGPLISAVKRLIHRNVDGCFIPSPVHSRHFESLGFQSERQIFGVDVVDNHRFAAAASIPLSMRPRRFLFVGRLIEKKGLPLLLDTYARYRAVSRAPWDLDIVGDGPLRPIVESNMTAGVRYRGALFGSALISAYSEAQCVIVPSSFEQWGLVINEACASGAIVIATTHCGAALSLIDEGRNGWLFGPEDVTRLIQLMLRTEELGPEIDPMGQYSFKKVESVYPIERFAAGVDAAMDIARRGPPGFAARVATLAWDGRVSVR